MEIMTRKFAILLVVLLVMGGCTLPPKKEEPPITIEPKKDQNVSQPPSDVNPFLSVKPDDLVSVHYIGKLEDGSVFDSSIGKEPLEFVAGAGMVIKGFDNGIIGMKLNEEKTIVIPPELAYGNYNENNIEFIARRVFEDQNIDTDVGTKVFVRGEWGKVIGTDGNNTLIIRVDFNHELAGKTLIFNMKVVEIKRKI